MAGIAIIKQVQGKFVRENPSFLNLAIFSAEGGILRAKTRLVLYDKHDAFKYPIVLPS